MLKCLVIALLTSANFYALAQSSLYRSIYVDQQRQLHIRLYSGEEIRPTKLDEQVAFGEPKLSPDGKIAGWFAYYPYPGATNSSVEPIAGNLVLYQSGRIFHVFSTAQIFWSWQFVNQGHQVAFCTGPTHGGAAICELHRVDSGKLLARWFPADNALPPSWAKSLHY